MCIGASFNYFIDRLVQWLIRPPSKGRQINLRGHEMINERGNKNRSAETLFFLILFEDY